MLMLIKVTALRGDYSPQHNKSVGRVMIKLKSATRVIAKTVAGTFKEYKGELYKGYGINKITYDGLWRVTVQEGKFKGWAVAEFKKKEQCRKLIDEIIIKVKKTDFTLDDYRKNKELLKLK